MKNTFLKIILLQFTLLHGDTTIVAFDDVHHFFGGLGNYRTIIDTIQFPDSNDEYSDIFMYLELECPDGGCDPWDRKAKISVQHLNEWFEIGRYVTPYGIGCGWSFDVTDYRSILEGMVGLQSYIDTWVQPGWLVTIEFEFISGTPEHPFTTVRNVWNYDYVVYGDNTNPVNISTVTEYIPEDAQNGYLRMITTGHGQGNTDNAAEFSLKLHDIFLNGELAYTHDFWRDDCEYNNCSPQYGTWQYDRAGFCPGDKVEPQDFSILEYSLTGDTIKLNYILEDYFNECSPNNPSCVDGITCSLCSYNNSGHTEPYYFIASHLIFHTELFHSNADAFFAITDQDSSTGALEIYFENYVPVYGLQFSLDLGELEGLNVSELIFQNGTGGRAEESGWTVSINDSGLVIGLAQGTGNSIPAGEGLLTQIPWNSGDFPELSGPISIVDIQVSGYFGTELSHETGQPYIFEPSLSLTGSRLFPKNFTLHQNYPNPFNPVTTLWYDLPEQAHVNITIYNMLGRQIKTIINENQDAGYKSLQWNATNDYGKPVSAGIYLYQIQAGEYISTKKLVLLK